MTVNEFIKKLEALQPKLREKDIILLAPNGMECEPEIKMQLIDEYNLFGGTDNIKHLLITW